MSHDPRIHCNLIDMEAMTMSTKAAWVNGKPNEREIDKQSLAVEVQLCLEEQWFGLMSKKMLLDHSHGIVD